MPYRKHSPAKKAEAIALATVIGAEAAGERLGIYRGTIRRWMEAAGKAPADAIARTDWETLEQLALSKTIERVASGKASARETAIVAGIANRNKRKPDAEPKDPNAWMSPADRERYGPHDPDLSHLSDAELEDLIHEVTLELTRADMRSALEELYRFAFAENGEELVEWVRQLPDDDIVEICGRIRERIPDDVMQQAIEDRRRAAEEGPRLRRIEAWTAQLQRYEPGSMTYRHLMDLIVRDGGTVPKDPEVEALLEAAEAFLAESAA